MRSSAFVRWSGLAAALGGLVWTTSWLLNGQTAEGNRAVLGLTKGNYRALLNPAPVFFILGLVATHRRRGARFGRLGLVGLVVALAGYGLLLVGNVVEFGLIGAPWQLDLGWAIVLPSFLVLERFALAVRATVLAFVMLPVMAKGHAGAGPSRGSSTTQE